ADERKLDRLAEALHGSQVAIGKFRTEAGDLEHLLQRPGAAHDLAVNGPDRGVVKRPLIALADVLEDFFFPSRREDFAAVFEFDPTNLAGQACTFVSQFEDL